MQQIGLSLASESGLFISNLQLFKDGANIPSEM
jgi:hypothetical protein